MYVIFLPFTDTPSTSASNLSKSLPFFQAIIQYENGRALSRRLAANVLSGQTPSARGLRKHAESFVQLVKFYPDEESSSPNVARSLLPTVRKLKWSLQRDRVAKAFKDSGARLGVTAWAGLMENLEGGS